MIQKKSAVSYAKQSFSQQESKTPLVVSFVVIVINISCCMIAFLLPDDLLRIGLDYLLFCLVALFLANVLYIAYSLIAAKSLVSIKSMAIIICSALLAIAMNGAITVLIPMLFLPTLR